MEHIEPAGSTRPSYWSIAVDRLPTSAFAFVMATGITSTALDQVGARLVAHLMLAVAGTGFIALVMLLAGRLAMRRTDALLDAQHPQRAFGYFTIVAAIGVLVVQVAATDLSWLATPMFWAAAVTWLILTYGLPAALMLRHHDTPVASELDGGWFLWVVGTQAVAIALTVAGPDLGDALPLVAVSLWSIGIVLYLMLATLIVLRLLSAPNAAESMTPSYWIFMGATAISVLAAAHILMLPEDSPVIAAMHAFVAGFAVALWAFGTWWIPLLVVFGVWRHGIAKVPLTYETGLWSMVFPLGMYAVATMVIGDELSLDALDPIGHAFAWIALAAWLAVAGSALTAALSMRARGH